MFCRSLFVLLYFFFWPLCCLFLFDIRILLPFGIFKLFLKGRFVRYMQRMDIPKAYQRFKIMYKWLELIKLSLPHFWHRLYNVLLNQISKFYNNPNAIEISFLQCYIFYTRDNLIVLVVNNYDWNTFLLTIIRDNSSSGKIVVNLCQSIIHTPI